MKQSVRKGLYAMQWLQVSHIETLWYFVFCIFFSIWYFVPCILYAMQDFQDLGILIENMSSLRLSIQDPD